VIIARALADLPQSQREAIVLVDVEGYSVEEAAGILDCPPGTVKSRCSRGRAKLAQTLGFLRNHPPPPTVTEATDDDSGQHAAGDGPQGSDERRGGEHASER
jgi:DNA-directed RNA polymerase specialized sigma subunit, sigma24 homolog